MNAALSPDTANPASAPSGVDMSIFACSPDAFSPIGGGLVILACFVLIAVLTRLMFSFNISLTKGKFQITPKGDTTFEKEEPLEVYDELITDLTYLNKCQQLSELMLSELVSAIHSYEKKALAIIASAAALIGFIATKSWCDPLTIWVGNISMLFFVIAIGFAVFILTASRIGYSGSSPFNTVNYYRKKLLPVKRNRPDLAEYFDEKNAASCYLCLMVLRQYSDAIKVSRETEKVKLHRFAYATWFTLSGLITAIGWLVIKALPAVF